MYITKIEYGYFCHHGYGYCTKCDDITVIWEIVEPFAEGVKCPKCEEVAVMGVELAEEREHIKFAPPVDWD